jgi:cell division septal protein FtsQ
MDEVDQPFAKHSKQSEKESATRKLKRLRIILIFWLVLFMICLIWFSL